MLSLVSPTAQDKFNALLGERIAPWLKDRGFRRKDVTFRREHEGAWQIINFQRSRHSDAGVVPVAVNLGVGLSLLHDEPRWAARGWPLEYECDFRQRLGSLLKDDDHWWRVRPLLPVGPTAKEMLRGLEAVGIPWLDLHSRPRDCLTRALDDLAGVSALNLHSLVLVARTVGTDAEREAIEHEIARWQRGERTPNL
jgi:hypothetical protein